MKTLFPELISEWNSQNKLAPDEYLPNYSKAVWWSCDRGHPPYLRPIRERTNAMNRGCPICMKSAVVADINDAKSHYPKLEKIWDFEGNKGIRPETISFESAHQYSFICQKGHHWVEGLPAVINSNFTCAICEGRKPLLGFNTLQDLSPDIAEAWDYDSHYNKGISPESVTTVKGSKYAWICEECGHSYLATIPEKINDQCDCPYCQSRLLDSKLNSFQALYPDLAKEYSVLNKSKPDKIFPTCYEYVKWNCPVCKNIWTARIRDRLSITASCPFCNGSKAIPGVNSLKAMYPDIAEELSEENERDSDTTLPSLKAKVSWSCQKCNQRWVSTVADRINGSASCPYCDGRKAIPGITSLKALYSEIAEEFSADNNRDPDTVLPTSSTYTVWSCRQCNQTWGSSIADRVGGLASCPYCDGRKAIPGVTSLEVLYPELISEWNELANIFIEAADTILPKSTVTAWWRCSQCGFNYTARIKDRVRDILRSRNTCSYCKGYRRIKHYII